MKVNRKLIRTTLAEVKGREGAPASRERAGDNVSARDSGGGGSSSGGGGGASRGGGGSYSRPMSSPGGGGGGGGMRGGGGGSSTDAAQGRKRVPPTETNAEIFYYKKQMDAHTLMVIVLQDGEEVEGTIEWYDRAALKVNRTDEPNILLLKHNIKYMYKAEDRDGGGDDEGDDADG